MRHPILTSSVGGLLGLVLLATSSWAATYHVDATAGDDTRDGGTPQTAWKTLGKAAGSVQPGDTVVVGPGVYFEHVTLNKAGRPDKPITFKADSVQPDRVIITGANKDIREGKATWKLEDEKLGLYSTKIAAAPARVVADKVDLFPYPDLASLKTLSTKGQSADKKAIDVPAPAQGFAFEKDTLYVRLGKKYGAEDPAKRVMQVGPAGGTGSANRHANLPHHANFRILTDQPANVVLEGFTFEVPGVTGVLTDGGKITVRDSWFRGCRTAVSAATDNAAEGKRADDVTVERCDFSQFPALHDVADVLARISESTEKKNRPATGFWMQRGNCLQNYALGFVLKAGYRWTLKDNYIHDCFEGISAWSIGASKDLEVSGNVFERIVDSGIETGNAAAGLKISGNQFTDVREVFSYNPKGGTPWPGPVFVHHNVASVTEDGQRLWAKLDVIPTLFEIVANDENWADPRMKTVPKNVVAASGAGFVAYQNTLFAPKGVVFSLSGMLERRPENFHFVNNIIVASGWAPSKYRDSLDFQGCKFAGNLLAPALPSDPGPADVGAGAGGRKFGKVADLKISAGDKGTFALSEGSPALGTASKSDLPGVSPDIGAVAKDGSGWKAPTAGPKVTAPAATASTDSTATSPSPTTPPAKK